MTKAVTRKGKVIMIATQKSQTHADMKKTFYTDFIVAKADKTVKGIVQTYKVPEDQQIYEVVKGFQNVLVIHDEILQNAAQKLYDHAEHGGPKRFFTIDEAKAAVTAFL